MIEETYTNSSLSTGRLCLTKYDLAYNWLLEPDTGEPSETLSVGHTWHAAHEHAARIDDANGGYAAINARAPSLLWAEKLRRLYAAYSWHWQGQPLRVVDSEWKFDVTLNGRRLRGKVDAVVRIEDGRRGIIELKTAGESVEPEAKYWNRLRMDPQTGIYALAYMQRFGELPSFVLYDVVRKPTIEPKRLEKKDLARLNKELLAQGVARYYDELFDMSMLEWPLEEGRESIALYGARLTADIGDRPGYYFARRTVDRIAQDFEALRADLGDQMELLELAGSMGLRPRNPDACFEFGRPCDFFALCSHNEQPREGQPIPPGYRQREHKHPELAD